MAQILLDPYCRTLAGFQVLIEKEFCAFGHMFRQRCNSETSERSPTFLQFLDAVHQVAAQYPTRFEFSDTFLLLLADACHAGIFSQFVADDDRSRAKASAPCAFDYFRAHYPPALLRNERFREEGATERLRPCFYEQGLRDWAAFHSRFCPWTARGSLAGGHQ